MGSAINYDSRRRDRKMSRFWGSSGWNVWWWSYWIGQTTWFNYLMWESRRQWWWTCLVNGTYFKMTLLSQGWWSKLLSQGASTTTIAFWMFPWKIFQQMFRKVFVSTLFWEKKGVAVVPQPPWLHRPCVQCFISHVISFKMQIFDLLQVFINNFAIEMFI